MDRKRWEEGVWIQRGERKDIGKEGMERKEVGKEERIGRGKKREGEQARRRAPEVFSKKEKRWDSMMRR